MFLALLINEECIACGACEGECPNEAITSGDDIFLIDPDKCTECYGFYASQQCVDVCPVTCIVPSPEHQESKDQLAAKFQSDHPGTPLENIDTWTALKG